MHDPNALQTRKISELKKALIERLAERVASIAENWYTLAQVNWDLDTLHRLRRHIEDLSADSAKFGLAQVTDSVSSLDISLAPYMDSALRPSPQKIDEVFARVRALISAADITVRTEARAISPEIAQEASSKTPDTLGDTQGVQVIAPDSRAFTSKPGLLERGDFLKQLSAVVASNKLNFCALLLLEPDNLERLGKRPEHSKADAILNEAGTLIAAAVEREDLTSRLGESTCAVFARRPTSEGLLALAEQLRRTIETHLFQFHGELLTTTASIGVCEVEDNFTEADSLLTGASSACAAARTAGGNRIEIYNPDRGLRAVGKHEHWVPGRLRQALQQDGFQIRLQARINMRTGAVEAYEVAPILPIPGGGHLPRSNFLAQAKAAKLLDQIDCWIIEHALGLMDKYRREGDEVHLLIKQSAAALAGRSRIEWLRERLQVRQLVGTGLSLEFDLADLRANLNAVITYSELLSRMGVSLSVTGFDADTTAFEALKRLPVEYIELHERFATLQPGIMASLIEEVHALGAKVVRADDTQQENDR